MLRFYFPGVSEIEKGWDSFIPNGFLRQSQGDYEPELITRAFSLALRRQRQR